jgi:hypothetical protein
VRGQTGGVGGRGRVRFIGGFIGQSLWCVMEPGIGFRRELYGPHGRWFAVELSSSAVLSFVIGLLICGIEIAYSEIEFLYNTVSCRMVELSFPIVR